MIVNVLPLSLGNEKRINVSFDETIQDFDDMNFKFDSDVHVEGYVTFSNDIYRFDGNLEYTGVFVCDRCVDEFKKEIKADFFEEFKVGASEEDDDFMPVVNDKIDLLKSVIKNIKLNVPLKLLCSDDCQGISYKRDERVDEKTESPFDVLKNIKL